MTRLGAGFRLWLDMGPVQGTRAALRAVHREAAAPLRRMRLRRRPLRATPREVARALGARSAVEILRGPVLAALPSVARFERELEAQPGLAERADEIVAHRFDLLGSGPTDLGREIDWQRDFKSGRSWPLAHISQVPVTYPDDSDIKVPWELSRFQHLPLLAGAFRTTGDRSYLDEMEAQLTGWIARNPVEFGANWKCTMDVAIRASNWTAALAMVATDAEKAGWLDDVVANLLLHGRFIRSHLEWYEFRGNHYLSDVVGVLPLAALFPAEGWAPWAASELAREMEHQVRPDGCDHEASIPYHRLVTELFVCGTQAAEALGESFPDWYRERLTRMLGFTRDYTRPDGLAPQIGDADDGRFLPLGDYGADPRSHAHLGAGTGATSSSYPDGGYYVMRAGDVYAIVRCGDTGIYGRGWHSHNDQLSLELCVGGHPLVVDPGSYLYTADPAARNLFRSTGYHSTLAVDGREQNELRSDYLFSMTDTANAECLGFDGSTFTGRHQGFAPATHTRTISIERDGVTVVDTIESAEEHDLEWTFPLAPGADVSVTAEGLRFDADDGWYSPSYGVRVPTVFLRARRRSRPGRDVTEIQVRRRPGARG